MIEYDVLGNERHKAICELAKMPDKYPNVDHVCMADLGAWKNELAQAIGAGDELFATIRDRLIHLLGGDRKSNGADAPAAGRVSGRSRGCLPPREPITTGLRKGLILLNVYDPELMHLCNAIDAIHAQLEHDYYVACDVNDRQDEEYVRLKAKNAGMAEFCERVEQAAQAREDVMLWGVSYTALPLDADGVPIHVGDVMEWIDLNGEVSLVFTVEAVGTDCFFAWDKSTGRFVQKEASAYRHYHAPTVEDVLRGVVTLCHNMWKEGSPCRYYDVDDVMESGNIADFAAKLQLRDADA